MGTNVRDNLNLPLPPGATPLTPEEIEGLIPRHVTTRKELYDAEFINISDAGKKYFLSRKEFSLTVDSLFKIHKDMFKQVWKWAGQKRKTNKNIGVERIYIEVELKKFVDDLEYWLQDNPDYIEISAKIHHRLVSIHPFNNGNGRWARFVVTLFLKKHMNAYLDFPEDDLFVSTTLRKQYIKALQDADNFDLQPLENLHRRYLSKFS
jgi:Fic-DOC domain mobile mystery protein B